jgi:hypothetical protein
VVSIVTKNDKYDLKCPVIQNNRHEILRLPACILYQEKEITLVKNDQRTDKLN